MKQLRLWLAALCGWLFLLFNVERMYGPINVASFVYVAAAASALLIILSPKLQTAPLPWLLIPLAPAVILFRLGLGYPTFGEQLPILTTELSALVITVILSRRVGRVFEDFHTAAVNTLVSHLHDRSLPFQSGQSELYREVRRARAFDRPLALLAVSPKDSDLQDSLDRFTKEFQRDTVRAYARARVAELLSGETKDCDVIAQRDEHFITLLPETDREKAIELARTLEAAAREELDLELNVGLSVFPDEEVTLVKLLERAEGQMKRKALLEKEPRTNGRKMRIRTRADDHEKIRASQGELDKSRTTASHTSPLAR